MRKRSVKRGSGTIRRVAAFVFAYILISLLAPSAHAYPDTEIDWTFGGAPPFSFGVTATPSGFDLMSDTRLAISYNKVLKLIDMGSYSEEASQPFDLSSDEDTNSIITAIAYVASTNEIVASQEDGTFLLFGLSDITAKPNFIVIAADESLGPIAVDSVRRTAYVANNESRTISVIDLVSLTVTRTITLTITGSTSFKVTDAHYLEQTDEFYFTTDGGGVFYFVPEATTATLIDVDVAGDADLVALDQLTSGSYPTLYVINATDTEAVKIDPQTHTVDATTIDLTPNADLTDITITNVSNPTAVYAYVAGANGMSVINTATDEVFDFGTDPGVDREPLVLSAEPLFFQASTKSDGFIYAQFTTGGMGVISENPFVKVSSLTYSGGGTSLGAGQSFTVTFASDRDGTYDIRVGGDNLASGTLLVDSSGASSGTITADTDTAVTINYDDNASLLAEGANAIWVFVTEGDLRGRRSTEVTVDTPPPDVVISSTGFGNEKVYVNFERIDVEDMSTYNIYADTDPAAVLTKTDASATVAQPSSGSSVTGAVDGLTNGTLYYFAMEAVDANGNVSPNRTSTYADGSRVTGQPEATEGPAAASGEAGCALGGSPRTKAPWALMALTILASFAYLGRRARPALMGFIVVAIFLLPAVAEAQIKPTDASPKQIDDAIQEGQIPAGWDYRYKPSGWTLEAKTGFWMPSSSALKPFYGKCCNMWTRLQVGHLWRQKYGVEGGIGFHYKSGKAIGTTSGSTSQESYSFLLIPIEVSGVWRADYWENFRYLIPYLKAGFDGVIFRERASGNTVKGIKWGVHGTGGLQFNIGMIGDAKRSLAQIGISDFFLTLETEYQWINNFGGKGLNLSGPIFSIGFLFYF